MLSAALLRFPHGERSGNTEPPGWALSRSPLPGSVLKPPPRPWLLLQLLRPLRLFPLRSLWAFPSSLRGFGFIHPSLLAPSQQPAAGWQGLGRRPALSARPRQSGTTLASPQGASSCGPYRIQPGSTDTVQTQTLPSVHGQGPPPPAPCPTYLYLGCT